MPKGKFVFCLKARKTISKGYLYHLVMVRDVYSETRTIDSVLNIKEFPKVFLDIYQYPPEREIDFGIDLLQQTQHISILLIEWL